MLTQSRQSDEKTIMGILSLLPGLREISHLNAEIAWYHDNEARSLYVWQKESQGQVLGVLGVEIYNNNIAIIRHVALTPESRSVRNYFDMISDYQEQHPEAFLMGTLDNQKLINKWRKATSRKTV
ncbi:riboflavin biosynthesis protein RibT [Leuconostoc suionicum]|uniref:riboflavin biosynthesis protein RibT n=1 Tax=Leuconostoc suionicum TaxID=1511761 RepID=UPI00233F14EF|nr:riboflavin biosynthesis protein RibT [Leuconostoc suionicum]MDC2804888.1 riboflavin biosynthesis protein RibT [Leuconostoc suionicum]MDC2816511.1 riboflavin biosynthesis protein RibT [Leuconostoc suionicum]MDC2822400.1 riboflavin biosynthesis protein RibT [Leuconostoc suionicum]